MQLETFPARELDQGSLNSIWKTFRDLVGRDMLLMDVLSQVCETPGRFPGL